MSEYDTPMEAFEMNYRCEKCGLGNYITTGQVFTTYPAAYAHECSNKNCGDKRTFSGVKYPRIEHRLKAK